MGVAKLLPEGSINETGRAKVDEFLAVEGCPNVFALGDCCNTPDRAQDGSARRSSRRDCRCQYPARGRGKTEEGLQAEVRRDARPFRGVGGCRFVQWVEPSQLCCGDVEVL